MSLREVILTPKINEDEVKFSFFTPVKSQTVEIPSCSESELIVKLKKMVLNSQRIKHLFDSYGVEVVFQDDNLRITNLFSGDDNGKTMRTLAIVNYSVPVSKSLEGAHRKIISGDSIGETIKDSGFLLRKEAVYLGTIQLPKFAKTNMNVDSDRGTVHIYDLYAKKNCEQESKYCTITEIHSPAYLPVSRLMALYQEEYKKHNDILPIVKPYQNTISKLDSFLESVQENTNQGILTTLGI
jgi:hypothetical protein